MLSCRYNSTPTKELTSLSRVSVFRKLDCTPSAAVCTVHLCPPQNAAEGVRSRFSTALPLQRFGGVASPPALCMQPNCCFRCRFWGAVPLQPNGCSHQPPPKRLQSECLPRRVFWGAVPLQRNCSFRMRFWSALTLQPNGLSADTLKRLQSESTPRDVLERTLAAAKLLLSGTPLEGRHSAAVSPVCSDTLKRLQSDSSPRGLFWGAVTLQPNGMFAASPPKRLRVSASRGEADN